MKRSYIGNTMLFAAALIWGTAFVFQSLGVNAVGPFTLSAARMLLGGLVLLPVIAIFGRKFDALSVKAGIICGIVLTLGSNLQQTGIMTTSAGKAGFITALYIVIVPLLSIFLRKKISRRVWLCVMIAVLGFYMLCVKEDFSVARGDLIILCASVCFSAHILCIDYYSDREADGIVMSCVQFLTVSVISGVLMVLFEEPSVSGLIEAKWSILYLGICSSGIAYTLQILGQQRTQATIGTLIMSLESVFAALAGWLFLHEHMSAKELLGCLLVFTAVIIAQLPGHKKKNEGTHGKKA